MVVGPIMRSKRYLWVRICSVRSKILCQDYAVGSKLGSIFNERGEIKCLFVLMIYSGLNWL